MLPQVVPGEVAFHPGDAEENQLQDESSHQWRTTKDGNSIYVEGGTIIYQDIVLQVGGHAFAEPTEEWDAWCKITRLPSGEPTEGVIEDGSLAGGPPADTDGKIYRRLAEVFNGHWEAPGKFYGKIRQLQFEPIRLGEESGGALQHQWRVTANPVAEGESPTLSVVGGTINTQETFEDFFVADEPGLVAASGEVTLKITRDDLTRNITDAVIELYPTGSFPTSDYYEQYVTLAVVTMNEDGKVGSILQTKFEDIAIFEDLAVVDGEFRFVPLAMHGRTHYSPPL